MARYSFVAECTKAYAAHRAAWLAAVALAIAVTVPVAVRAQYDVHLAHYYDLEPSFNAAAIGKQAKLNIAAAYAMDMAGFEHNPQTAYIAADMPVRFLNSTHGVGFQMMNDRLGLFSHTRLALQYAPRLRLAGGTLAIGLQAGLLMEKFDGAGLDLEDSSDPAFTSSAVNGNSLDLAAGLYYQHRRFYLGLSAQHLTAPTVKLGELNELKIDPHYYATAGVTLPLRNPALSVRASALGQTDGVMWRADVTGRLIYTNERRQYSAGVSYSPTNSVTVLLSMVISGVNVGYSYECYTNGLSVGNGSHELAVTYQIDLNLGKHGRNLHKAVRIL